MIEGLSPQGIRAFSFLQKGISEGLSGRAILSELKEAGLSYRWSTFYRDLRLIRASEKDWSTLKYNPHNRVLPEESYKTAKAPLETNFQTTFKVRGVNSETGEIEDHFITIGHDTPMLRGELEEEVLELIGTESVAFEPIEVMPVRALKSPVVWEV